MSAHHQESSATSHRRANAPDPFAAIYKELEDLSKKRDDLQAECDRKISDRSDLSNDIEKLTRERECLRIEFRDAIVDCRGGSSSRSASPAPASLVPSHSTGGGIGALGEFDEKGKLKRKVWLLEHQLVDEAKKLKEERQAKEDAVNMEAAIAQSLRERIGRLEGKVRVSEKEASEAKEREEKMKKDWEVENATKASQQVGLRGQLDDVKENLLNERQAREKVEVELAMIKKQKMDMEAELGLARTRNEHLSVRSPLRVLQPHQINIAPPPKSPTTPSKSRSRQTSPSPSPRREHQVRSGLSIRFDALQKQHEVLKKSYDKLRAQYSNDLKHWKEYKESEVIRIEEKKRVKAEKRAERAARRTTTGAEPIRGLEPVDVATSTAEELVAASDASQSVPQRESIDYESLEEKSVKRLTTTTKRESSRDIAPAAPFKHVAKAIEDPKDIPVPWESALPVPMDIDEALGVTAPLVIPRPTSSQRSRSNSTPNPYHHAPAPTGRPDECEIADIDPALLAHTPVAARRNIPIPHRVTPWLGQDSPRKVSSTDKQKRKAREMDDEDDDVFDDMPTSVNISTPTTTRTPLVRDRTGGANTSLRKNTLRKTVSSVDQIGATPLGESSSKKRHVEREHLTPTQKARERKNLANMTSKQKREYYAEYKGNGRYLPPEEVRLGVYEDYEVDPEQNEGENYQFHDVKRRKAERQLMHGGDCECCKDYYEAVGPVPKYNQGPRWKDPSQSEGGDGHTSREAELTEHQNKVSRHRETWRRPATPPGYWAIGFPTTQLVHEQNAKADEMVAKREAEVRREAAHKDSKWRKKA